MDPIKVTLDRVLMPFTRLKIVCFTKTSNYAYILNQKGNKGKVTVECYSKEGMNIAIAQGYINNVMTHSCHKPGTIMFTMEVSRYESRVTK